MIEHDATRSTTETPQDHVETGRGNTRVVAVSGGIGSGKSTVCRMMEELGASVFHADEVAKDLMNEDGDLRRALIDTFGEQSYASDGRLNRAYLASRIFLSEEERQKMNAIVHPRVRAAFREELRDAIERKVAILVHESALAPEISLDDFDAVVIVESPLARRVDRVAARDGSTPERVRARARRQPTEASFRSIADFLIENDGTLAELKQKVEQLWPKLLEHRRAARPDPPARHRPDG